MPNPQTPLEEQALEEISGKFFSLEEAVRNKNARQDLRIDFLDACINYADKLRVRTPLSGSEEVISKKIIGDYKNLKSIRDHLFNWVTLEVDTMDSEQFSEELIAVLERLIELKSQPSEIRGYTEQWCEPHGIFTYETFLYIISALLRCKAYEVLHKVYFACYRLPSPEKGSNFTKFDRFWIYSDRTGMALTSLENERFPVPVAELIKRQADLEKSPFEDIMQAELLTCLITLITPDTQWYPHILHGGVPGDNRRFTFFINATRHDDFNKLAIITGINSADELRKKASSAYDALCDSSERNVPLRQILRPEDIYSLMNIKDLDTKPSKC